MPAPLDLRRGIGLAVVIVLASAALAGDAPAQARSTLPRKKVDEITKIADAWFAARPKTAFETWDPALRDPLAKRAAAVGELADADFQVVVDAVWKAAQKHAPKWKESELPTPYGPARWIERGKGGRKQGFALGLHGGGEGVGDAGEAAGTWNPDGCLCAFPQGIRLVHDTWNTVHGEKFALSLIEYAKWRHEVDPDRVYVMGFSMGGSGSFFLAGRHPDLFAGAIPAHGVLMAEPMSQLEHKQEVKAVQHGLLPNLRNLTMYWYTGSADRNCRPGTYLFAWDRLLELRAADPEGYRNLTFACHEGLAHAFPTGEPKTGLEIVLAARRVAVPDQLVWEYASDPFPQAGSDEPTSRFVKEWYYYLRCRAPADAMRITVVKDRNEFDVTATGIDPNALELLLNPRMIDPAQNVVVRVNGRAIADGKPVPDFWTILESLDARMDRTLVFDRRVRLATSS